MFRSSESKGLMILVALCGTMAWFMPVSVNAQPAGSTPKSSSVTPERQAVIDAQKTLNQAQGEANNKKKALEALKTTARQTFNTSPEMVEALAAQKKANSDLESAKAKVLASLRSKPEYTEAVKKRDAVRQKMVELQTANAAQDQISKAAGDMLDADTAVDKMENTAYDKDTAVAEAKKASAEALKKVNELRKAFEETLKTDSGIAAAQTAVDTAMEAVKTATAAYKTAQKAEADARASRTTGGARGG